MMPNSFYPEVVLHWRTFRGVAFAVILFYSIFDPVYAFNVDILSAVTYHGANQSMFGFTVAQYKEAKDGESWVLIGAPESEDSIFDPRYPNYKGGAVYRCDVNKNDSCDFIEFPSIHFGSPDNRSRQWLGATLSTAAASGSIVACAPLYHWYGIGGDANLALEPVGSCYYSDSGFNFIEYSPCRTNLPNASQLAYCQAGFSASISKDGDRFYMGTVGHTYWRGEVVASNKHQRFNETKQLGKQYNDSYLGYSMIDLDFYGFTISGIAAGVPRAKSLRGEVKLYTWDLINVKNLTGKQFGAYFGYSIGKSDVDGDGADDLIIGAPMYSHFESMKKEYETGRIYVYYQGNAAPFDSTCWAKKFTASDFIDGEHSKGRFGLAVASLGDINQDGFGDFAVGAPYEGSFQDCNEALYTGAVYIYHGGKNGVKKKYSQVIRAEDLNNFLTPGSSLRTFGFSISGGQDLDNNLYPDVVVGAYESDAAFSFRSKPVIKLDVDFKFLSEKKVIDLEEYRCNLETNIRVPCVVIQMCLVYDGIGVENDIKLLLEITLDSEKHQASRMFFLDREGERIIRDEVSLHKGTSLCRNMTTYIAPLKPNQDKLTPLEAQLKYSLVESSYHRSSGLSSVLNLDDEIPLTWKDSMNIKINCGDDNICIPDLQMSVNSNVNQYALGSGQLILNVSILNEGEDSFGSNFKLKIPSGMNYSRYEVTKTENDVVVACYSPKDDNNFTIYCDVGNPLPSGKMVNFSVILEPKDELEESRFEFWATCNSTNAEFSNTTANNEKLFYVPIVEETSLSIVGMSSPENIHFNISHYEDKKNESDKEAGPILKHEYIIRNLGPSKVSEAIAVFYWPMKISTNEDLLYLLNEPETKGNIKCEKFGNTNYRDLTFDRSGYQRGQSEYEGGQDTGLASNGFESNHLCSSAKCAKIQCHINHLNRDQEVSVTFSSIVWVKTFQKMASFRPVEVGSYVEVNVTKLLLITSQVSNLTYTSEILTNITSLDFEKTPPDVVPLWIVVGAITLGALILMLLIYLLYKSGFFKRNRPPKMPSEHHTLNKDGQYHLDDEAHDKTT